MYEYMSIYYMYPHIYTHCVVSRLGVYIVVIFIVLEKLLINGWRTIHNCVAVI